MNFKFPLANVATSLRLSARNWAKIKVKKKLWVIGDGSLSLSFLTITLKQFPKKLHDSLASVLFCCYVPRNLASSFWFDSSFFSDFFWKILFVLIFSSFDVISSLITSAERKIKCLRVKACALAIEKWQSLRQIAHPIFSKTSLLHFFETSKILRIS